MTFKMPEPVGYFQINNQGNVSTWEHALDTDDEGNLIEATASTIGITPLYTAQAIRDALEAAANIDWHELLREDGYVTNGQASDYDMKITAKIREMKESIK